MISTVVSVIKKFVNSDLTKPLNAMIDEIKTTLTAIKTKTDTITSGGTLTQAQADRLDTAVSTRATNAGVWADPSWRTTTMAIPSDIVLISNTAEYSRTMDTTTRLAILNFRTNAGGRFRIKLDIRGAGGNFTQGWATIYLLINGVEQGIIPKETAVFGSAYVERNYDVDIPAAGNCSIRVTAMHGSGDYIIYYKNIRLCASPDNSVVTKL